MRTDLGWETLKPLAASRVPFAERIRCMHLIRIWETERKTMLFVTRDIDEALQLGGRVLVMSRRPAT